MNTAFLIIADSEKDANLYYATQFLAPDPFIFIQVNEKKILLMSDLELDRAKSQAKVDEVLSLSEWMDRASRQIASLNSATTLDAVDLLLKEHQVKSLQVPATFPTLFSDDLRKRGYEVIPKKESFFPERLVKNEEEVQKATQVLRNTEVALEAAIQMIRASEIRGEYLYSHGQLLTSELIKKIINVTLMGSECVAQHTIVASGRDGVDPHHEGNGPLRANQPIILDVFPRSSKTLYFADITRTVVRGKASDKLKKMYRAVQEGQEIAFRSIRDGADGAGIHQEILAYFENQGFHTGLMGGRMQGFFHGTGHGVGLEIHEPPRISKTKDILRAGVVVTVEPGLYYLDAGGVRLEDMVVVTKEGCRNLTESPKELEL